MSKIVQLCPRPSKSAGIRHEFSFGGSNICAKYFPLPDERGEEGVQKMGFPRLKFSALSVFIVTLSSNLSGTAESQELSASDIPKIILTYYEDESKFERDYLGKTFTSTMFFHDVGGEAFRGGYFVGFDGKGGSAGLTCNFSESLPDDVTRP